MSSFLCLLSISFGQYRQKNVKSGVFRKKLNKIGGGGGLFIEGISNLLHTML